jgi:hypothetical protein
MACPQVVDRVDGLQIWRVAVNILNKQRGQPTRGGLPAWGLGGWLTTRETLYLLRCTRVSEMDGGEECVQGFDEKARRKETT